MGSRISSRSQRRNSRSWARTLRSRVPAAGLRGLASCCDARAAGLDHAPPQAAAKKSHMGSRSSVGTGLVFSTSKNVCLGRSNHGCHAFTFRAVAKKGKKKKKKKKKKS